MHMKNKAFAVLGAALLTSAVAQGKPAATTLTGTEVIRALASARGINVDPSVLRGTNVARLTALARDLRITLTVLLQLRAKINTPVSPVLATRAVLESVTGRTVTEAQAVALVRNNPTLAVNNEATLSNFISNPAAANAAVDIAQKPVTPTGA